MTFANRDQQRESTRSMIPDNTTNHTSENGTINNNNNLYLYIYNYFFKKFLSIRYFQ